MLEQAENTLSSFFPIYSTVAYFRNKGGNIDITNATDQERQLKLNLLKTYMAIGLLDIARTSLIIGFTLTHQDPGLTIGTEFAASVLIAIAKNNADQMKLAK